MTPKQATPSPTPPPFSLRDVYYILFRHKWMIILLVALGLGAGAGVYTLWPFPYVSEAKLFIRYVQETRGLNGIGPGDIKVTSPDERGLNILNSELEILTSRDVALTVADRLAAQGVLTRAKRDTNRFVTALFIASHLKVEVAKGSDVIRLEFDAKEPDIVQPVLTELIEAYKQKHAEIRLAPGVTTEFLQRQTDDAKNLLQQSIDRLRAEKIKNGITSADQEKTGKGDLAGQIQQQIFQFMGELAETRANVKDLEQQLALETPPPTGANSVTNSGSATDPAALANSTSVAQPSSDDVLKYQNLTSIISGLRTKEQSLLGIFTTNNLAVQAVQSQLATNEFQRTRLERQFPALAGAKTAPGEAPRASVLPATDLRALLRETRTKEHGLEAKIQELTNSFALVHSNAMVRDSAVDNILELQRNEELAEGEYKQFERSTKQAGIDEALGPGRVSGIKDAELPTPPAREGPK